MKHVGIISAALLAASACARHESDAAIGSDIVAQYRDTVLRVSDVVRQIPPGISPADSLAMTRKIIDQWIDGFLIEDLAASQIDDMDRIDELTQTYRRSLISESYRRKMRASGVQPVDKERVREYYRRHRADLKLERPLIKGLLIKAPATSRYIDDIRRWMKDGSAEACDELENIGIKETASFRFFLDRWADFDAVADEIPFRFGNADKFVEANTDFETEQNGTAYILHITDFRHSGSVMPEDYAAPIIEDRIKNNYLADYEKGLLRALRKTAIEKEILKEGNITR